MIEDKQGQSSDGYCAGKDDLDGPVVEQEFLSMVQTQHHLVLPISIVNSYDLVDVQPVGQDQGNQDEKIVGPVWSSRYFAANQAQDYRDCGDCRHDGHNGYDLVPAAIVQRWNDAYAELLCDLHSS